MNKETIKNGNKTTEYLDPETKKFKEGNPGGGRPRGSGISITTEIKNKLKEVPEGQKATYLQLLINRILKQAIQDGDSRIIELIWKYTDGSPDMLALFQQNNYQIEINPKLAEKEAISYLRELGYKIESPA